MISAMGEQGYETATIAELERPDGWSPIRKQLGVQAFGVNAWTAREAGGTLTPEHDEIPSGHEELYVVVAGRATFTVAGDEIDAPTGTVVFVPDPATKRGAVAREPGTTLLALGARKGAPYRPRAWETNVDVFPMFDQGRYEEAKELLLEALGQYEDQGTLLYNLACAEARLGNPAAALDYLDAALRERPDLRGSAGEDEDLAALREDPRFAELIGTG
jgi:quercetin dioxygenase-like cupin family protein